MTHPHDDTLLLVAYRELPEGEAAAVEAHLAACDSCHARFAQIERARVATDWALAPRARRAGRWAAAALVVAAAVAGLLLAPRGVWWAPDGGWSHRSPLSPLTRLSPSGYVAGGAAVITIDSLLTRLEQERDYAHR